MKIAIQAADLDASRIDGTRVYILNLLKQFGKLDSSSEFFIYHRDKFNPELTPPNFSNYKIKNIPAPFFWTQTRFAWQLRKDDPDVLWMPVHSLPICRKKKMKTVVTIHDLAFKFFPEYFTKKDLCRLNWLADYSIKNSDKIIAISESTKKDIIKLYPEVKEDKIKVIYHGFDQDFFQKKESPEELNKFLVSRKIEARNYLLYVGAIQPRKNLEVLIEAFEEIKKEYQDLKLVIVGEKAWLWERVLERIEKSPVKNDIILPGQVGFQKTKLFFHGALAFVFPSLYEGFGLPVLEAMASETPVISARNSSLPEVGGDAALYFKAENAKELAEQIRKVISDVPLRNDLIKRGLERIKKFSWENCAKETLEYLKN